MLLSVGEFGCIRAVRKGIAYRPRAQCRIRISVLRNVLLGRTTGGPPPKVMIDGGQERFITIVGDDSQDPIIGLLDLSHLSAPMGEALPALSLRGCRIQGVLDISGSDFAGFQLRNCTLRGLLGDGCHIGNSVTLDTISPQEEGLSLSDQARCCTVRMVAARIEGSLIVRNSLLVGPGNATFPEPDVACRLPARNLRKPDWPGNHANLFALTVAGAEIRGRLWIRNDVIAIGGISIYQADIQSSVRMEAGFICALAADGLPYGHDLAFSGEEARIGGSFLWGTPEQERTDADIGNRVLGKISMVRARIESDLLFERCEAVRAGTNVQNLVEAILSKRPIGRSYSQASPQPILTKPWRADRRTATDGGIDLRRATVKGQLAFYRDCRIGRRSTPVSGRARIDLFGSTLDTWKADIGLGILIDAQATFYGPVHLNSCVVGRESVIAGEIDFYDESHNMVPLAPEKRSVGPFHTALTLSDSRLAGLLRFDLKVSGRVVLERLEVEGSVEVLRLTFNRIAPAEQRDPGRPFEEISILDMQDVRISSGINLKRDAVSLRFTCQDCLAVNPANCPTTYIAEQGERDGFIVDMRGMSCMTWDDADATCWSGLVYPRRCLVFKRGQLEQSRWRTLFDCKQRNYSRWRLRFDGLTIQRIDSSRQAKPIDADSASDRFTEPRRRLILTANALYRLICWDARHIRLHRTYHVPSHNDTIAYRVQAIESYHHNKPSRRRFSQPVDWLWRWTLQPSWHRRKRIPTFSPQPYDEFARAYFARGDIEIAVELTMRRMTRQWRRYLRQFTQFWFLGVFLALPGFLIMMRKGDELWSWFLGVATISPLILLLLLLAFRYGFGFGLRARNAIITMMIFLMVVGLGLPAGASLWLWPPARPFIPSTIEPSAHFAFDKLLPLDFKQRERIEQPIIERISLSTNECQARLWQWYASTISQETLRHDTDMSPCHESWMLSRIQKRFVRLSDALDVIGWIVISLVLLTLSGVLRRDIERR